MPLTTVSQGLLSTDAQYTGFKNRVINGDMQIDQRNNGASVNASVVNASTYMVDRWRYYANTGASRFSYQQNAGSVTPPPGFTNYLGITSLTANSPASTDEYVITQRIEGFNIADLGWGTANAQSVTVSFWVRSSLTGNNFGACIKSANAGYNYPFNFSVPTANTWTFVSTTIPGPTIGTFGSTNGLGFDLVFNLGTGSAYLAGTSGAWTTTFSNAPTSSLNILGTNGATFYLTGVQLEKGNTATSFDVLPYGTELQLCQRYYQVLASGQNACLSSGFYFTSGILIGYAAFPTTMRTAPSIVATTGTNFYNFANTGGNDQLNSFTLDIASPNSVSLFNSSDVSGTAGFGGIIRCNNASASVAMQAEL